MERALGCLTIITQHRLTLSFDNFPFFSTYCGWVLLFRLKNTRFH